jgi:hypothetical protein
MQQPTQQRSPLTINALDTQTSSDVTRLLSQLQENHFYGSLELKFEAGCVVLLKKTETIKPKDSYRDNRGDTQWAKRHG